MKSGERPRKLSRSESKAAKALLKLRKRVGLKQFELAVFLGIGKTRVCNYESGLYAWPVRLAKHARAILLGYK